MTIVNDAPVVLLINSMGTGGAEKAVAMIGPGCARAGETRGSSAWKRHPAMKLSRRRCPSSFFQDEKLLQLDSEVHCAAIPCRTPRQVREAGECHGRFQPSLSREFREYSFPGREGARATRPSW